MMSIEYKICKTQGRIFRYAVQNNYDIATFAAKYLSSKFCEEAFDTVYSRYQLETPQECADFFIPEIEKDLVAAVKCQAGDEAAYVGFMYRYLYYVTGVPSKELAQRVPYEEIAKHFVNSNLRTEDFAIEDICKDFDLPITSDVNIIL